MALTSENRTRIHTIIADGTLDPALICYLLHGEVSIDEVKLVIEHHNNLRQVNLSDLEESLGVSSHKAHPAKKDYFPPGSGSIRSKAKLPRHPNADRAQGGNQPEFFGEHFADDND